MGMLHMMDSPEARAACCWLSCANEQVGAWPKPSICASKPGVLLQTYRAHTDHSGLNQWENQNPLLGHPLALKSTLPDLGSNYFGHKHKDSYFSRKHKDSEHLVLHTVNATGPLWTPA